MREAINLDTSSPPSAHQPAVRLSRVLLALGVWLGLAIIALLNAGIRETIFTPLVGAYWGHVTSTFTLILGISVVSYLYFGRYTTHSIKELLVIGLLWGMTTVSFEFGFGHYVMGTTWSTLFADYNLFAGRIWILIPLTMVVVPVLFGRLLR